MTDPTAEFFEELGTRGSEPLLRRTTGTVRFDLSSGKRTERWLVAITTGDLAVSRRNLRADCVVSTDRALFDDIVTGKTHAVAAALRDELRIEGDVRLVVAFQRLFPGPSRSRRRRRTTASAGRKR
jgi:putative sterol carrier protein